MLEYLSPFISLPSSIFVAFFLSHPRIDEKTNNFNWKPFCFKWFKNIFFRIQQTLIAPSYKYIYPLET